MKGNTRLAGLLLSALLLISVAAPAGAAWYPDLPEEHWAYDDINRAEELGIMTGVGNGLMAPDAQLTWGQYLTMVARTFAPNAYAGATAEGLAWDQAGYTVALEQGFLLEEDFLPVTADTLSEPILRQDVAMLLERALTNAGGEELKSYYEVPPASESLIDWAELDENRQAAVARLFELEIIRGKEDGTFGGSDTLRRCDGSVLLVRTLSWVDRLYYREEKEVTLRFVDEGSIIIAPDQQVSGYVGQSLWSLSYDVEPEGYVITDSSGTVSSLSTVHTITCRPMTRAEIMEEEAWEKWRAGEITDEEFFLADFWLISMGENDAKRNLLFGTPEKRRFADREEAQAAMTTVTVPVWNLARDGSKVSSTVTFPVHAALAEDVTAIFTEIYNDPEQFPIYVVGGYDWRGDSATGEHNCGTALDINPSENYQIRYGKVESGSLWEPGVNPYSIPADGSVVRIFADHGWSWGGDAWAGSSDPSEGYHDYMHFSYMGG